LSYPESSAHVLGRSRARASRRAGEADAGLVHARRLGATRGGGRPGCNVDEVVSAALFVISADASFRTGSASTVDGGIPAI
jgi:NAD(P)-dependent dehydrogenase (short-subunit alcohol dehydrogenase family)